MIHGRCDWGLLKANTPCSMRSRRNLTRVVGQFDLPTLATIADPGFRIFEG